MFVLSPSVVPVGATRVPLRTINYSRITVVLIFGGFAVFAGTIAYVADGVRFQGLMASLAVVMAAYGLLWTLWQESISPYRVRIAERAPGLRFAPLAVFECIMPLMAVLGLLPLVTTGLLASQGYGPTGGGILQVNGPSFIAVIVLAWLAQQVWSFRLPRGLMLTE